VFEKPFGLFERSYITDVVRHLEVDEVACQFIALCDRLGVAPLPRVDHQLDLQIERVVVRSHEILDELGDFLLSRCELIAGLQQCRAVSFLDFRERYDEFGLQGFEFRFEQRRLRGVETAQEDFDGPAAQFRRVFVIADVLGEVALHERRDRFALQLRGARLVRCSAGDDSQHR